MTQATLTVSDVDGSSGDIPGTLTWTIPSDVTVWWLEGDRLVPIVSGQAYPFTSLQSATIYIQGFAAGTGTLTATFQPTSGGDSASDGAIVNTELLDLTINSNNDGVTDPTTDDPANAIPGATGAIIAVDDSPGPDGLPGYAEGFNLPTAVAAAVAASGQYDAGSDPDARCPSSRRWCSLLMDLSILRTRRSSSYIMLRTPPRSPSMARTSTPAPGDLRIWTVDGTQTRSSSPIDAATQPGNFVPSGVADITPAQLGLTDSNRTITLYVEAVNAPGTSGTDQISVFCAKTA